VNDLDRWIYFDGPEPDRVRPFLDALRDLPPATPQDRERAALRFFETLDAALSSREARREAGMEEPPGEEEDRGDDAVAAPLAPPDADRRLADDGSTVRSPAGSSAESLETSAPLEPSHAGPPREHDVVVVYDGGVVPRPPVVRPPPAAIASTAMALELPAGVREQMAALPFKPPQPGKPGAARTQQVPVMPAPGFGETAAPGDDSIAKAVAALPFTSTVGAGVVPFPRLTLEQYASLHAELAVRPERSGETLLRYHVLHEAARGALDEHWRKQFADHPEARATFEGMLAQFTGWLRTLPA
jgi:hypothetical protein